MKRREDSIKRNKPVDKRELLRIMASPVKNNKEETFVFVPLLIDKE